MRGPVEAACAHGRTAHGRTSGALLNLGCERCRLTGEFLVLALHPTDLASVSCLASRVSLDNATQCLCVAHLEHTLPGYVLEVAHQAQPPVAKPTSASALCLHLHLDVLREGMPLQALVVLVFGTGRRRPH
jgi:hypothetical protein